ncbi:MAG: hypothetical protein IJ262_01300 [Clostridia bacterium]|nr:hypothetical protein [Clostridia bacterium]
MSNIIEDFYYGNIEPQELTTEITPRLKKKLSELVKKEEELAAKLSDEEKEKFANYASKYNEFSSISISDGFVSGFRFGARFTYDTFVANSKGGV